MWYENPVYDRPWDEAERKVVEEVKKAVFVASTIRDEVSQHGCVKRLG